MDTKGELVFASLTWLQLVGLVNTLSNDSRFLQPSSPSPANNSGLKKNGPL